MRPVAERTSCLPCGCYVGAPCPCDGPFECEYCGDLAAELYLVVDADPSVGYRDESEVCAGCLKYFGGRKGA